MSKKTNDIVSDIVTEMNDEDDSDSDVSQAGSISNVVISKEFKENVIKYIKFDDLIKQKQEDINSLKTQRKKCEGSILKHLEEVNISQVTVSDGNLSKKEVEIKKPLSEGIIHAVLLEEIKNPKKVNEIMKMMDSKRPVVQNVNLKRTVKKKKMNSSKKTGKK